MTDFGPDNSVRATGDDFSVTFSSLAWISALPVENVPVESISLENVQRVRGTTSGTHVNLLAELAEGLPPILVHRATMSVVDGAHRLQAAVACRRKTIAVRFFDGTAADAFALAVRMNVAHGLPLSLAERKDAARRLMVSHPQWSDRVIADTVGLSHKTVGAERRCSSGENSHSNNRIGKDGRICRREVAEGRVAAARIIAARPDASLREIAKEAGISVGTAKDVRDRISRSEPVVPRYKNIGAPVPAGSHVALVPQSTTPEPSGIHADPATARTVSASIQNHILRNLYNDPSLRFNDRGRLLLRRIAAAVVDVESWERITGDIPAHCRGSLAKLARANARTWEDLADRLESAMIADDVDVALGGGA